MDSLNSEDIETLRSALQEITEGDSDNIPLSDDLPKSFVRILQHYPTLSADVCNCIAYIGREETLRSLVASDGTLIQSIAPLLSSTDQSVVIQSLRAIGNLCHDEDGCRKQFNEAGGCPLLRDVIAKCSTLDSSPLTTKLQTVACGCLLNLCCNNEILSKAMFDLDVIQLLCEGFLSKCDNDMVLLMCLRALNVIMDSDSCSLSFLSTSPVPQSLSHALQTSVVNDYEDVIETVLEIVETHCSSKEKEVDDWCVSIVRGGCYDVLLTIPSSLTSKLLDITVVILSSDEALELIFDNSKLRELVYSLIKGDVDVQLKASATLVLANMARNDKNCQLLVQDGSLDIVSDRILDQPVSEENSKLHYAALSFIRNLSLPDINKLVMLEKGVVMKVISILNKSTDPTVIMKSLGCLRLLSTKNDICKVVCGDSSCVDRVNQVCEDASFDHIKIEGGRLVSSLVKHSSDPAARTKLAESSCIKWLLYLLKNEHMMIKNEGVVALVLLASLENDAFYKSLSAFSDGTPLQDMLTVVMETASREVFENCVTLLVLLKNKNDINTFVLSDKLKDLLLKSQEEGKDLSELLQTKIQQLLTN